LESVFVKAWSELVFLTLLHNKGDRKRNMAKLASFLQVYYAQVVLRLRSSKAHTSTDIEFRLFE
jgi:hypothetical protein